MIEFQDLNQMFFILSQRAADQYSITPILHHSFMFYRHSQLTLNTPIEDPAKRGRTWFFESNYTRD